MSLLNPFLFFVGFSIGSLAISRIVNLVIAIFGFKDPKRPLRKGSVLEKHDRSFVLVFVSVWVVLFSWLGFHVYAKSPSVGWPWLFWGIAATPGINFAIWMPAYLRAKRKVAANQGNSESDA